MSEKRMSDAFKSQEKVAFWSLVSELPNLAAQVVFAALSGSLMLMLDVVDSAGNLIQAGIVYWLSKKLQGSDKYRYDYGMGKIEAFGGFFSSAVMLLGLAVVFYASIHALIIPRIAGRAMLLAILLKIINVSIDVVLLCKQKKTMKGTNSGLIKSNMNLLKKNLIFDVVALLAITASFALKSIPAAAYFEPLICVACAIYIALQSLKIVRESIADLLDKTLDEDTQLKILKCLSGIWGEIGEFHGVRTRRSGGTVYIDLLVSFEDNRSYAEIYSAYEVFVKAAKEAIPNSVTAIVIGEQNP